RLAGPDDQVSRSRRRRPAARGASMAVRGGEIANWLAPHQEIHELAVVHHRHGSDLHPLIVHLIASAQALASQFLHGRIVHNGKEIGKHAALEAACEGSGCPRRTTKSWSPTEYVGCNQIEKHIGCGVIRKKNRSAIVF